MERHQLLHLTRVLVPVDLHYLPHAVQAPVADLLLLGSTAGLGELRARGFLLD